MTPTIIGTNVQGRPIPVNTPIVVVFNEKGNLTSAQRGIAIRSGIGLGPILRVHLLQDELATPSTYVRWHPLLRPEEGILGIAQDIPNPSSSA